MEADGGSNGSSSGSKIGIGARLWKSKSLGSKDYFLADGSLDKHGVVDTEQELSINAQPTEYRTYRRRWFGLITLTVMNIVVSWDVR